jgi:hypothetical protein
MTLTCRADLEQHTDLLEILAGWLEDYLARADRTQLALEMIGVSRERFDELIREGTALKMVFAAFASSISQRDEAA